mmetsp:Transcript_28473/g.51480  ORF Transcript_28473/g.51480 Transcript_28473/m.51480 type:complete len:105 (+) Transcript_28473:633-947(+)
MVPTRPPNVIIALELEVPDPGPVLKLHDGHIEELLNAPVFKDIANATSNYNEVTFAIHLYQRCAMTMAVSHLPTLLRIIKQAASYLRYNRPPSPVMHRENFHCR